MPQEHPDAAPSQRSFLCRLRPLSGHAGTSAAALLLDEDEAIVGLLPASDLRLPERGISRRHAAIQRRDGGYVVADLGSRNGTWVNGERIDAPVALQDGDEVRFGPLAFRFELLHREDAQLAIVADPVPAFCDEVTDRLGDPETHLDGLALAHRISRQLFDGPAPDVVRALGSVGVFLGAAGAALGEWRGSGEPHLLATYGDLGTNAEDPVLYGFFGEIFQRGTNAPCLRSIRFGTDPVLDCVGFRRPGADLLALVIRGSIADRHDPKLAGEVLLRLVDQTRQRASGRERRRIHSTTAAVALPLGVARPVSEAMRGVYQQIAQLQDVDAPILVIGETGVGKEHLVRLIHDGSARREGPFVAVNCAAIPADLLEAEMFGIGRGVASGVEARAGRFREAEGGTLFLDEIGELPLPLQAKLLRALATGEIQPVGRGPTRANVRVLTATNADLSARVKAGLFRADLFYRIAGFELHVPPLRERPADIPALVEHFLGRFSRASNKRVRGVSIRALSELSRYEWPGNVRQLENEVRRLVVVCPHDHAIESSMLSARVTGGRAGIPSDGLDLQRRVEQLEATLIPEALHRARGNRARAARLLGLSRNGLGKKMVRLGLGGNASGNGPGDA